MRITTYYSASRRLEDDPGPLRLVLSAAQFARVGVPMRYYWYGLALAEDYDEIVFSHEGHGVSHPDRWEWTPDEPGEYRLTLKDDQGGRVTQTIFVDADEHGGAVVTSITGDSNTAAGGPSAWPARLRAALIDADVDVTMIGGQQGNPDPQVGVYHEGFPGRTYQWHVNGTPPSTDVPPYIHEGELDLAHYESVHGAPTIALFALGTNDWGNNRLDSNLDADTAEDVDYARTLVDAFRAQWPTIPILILLTWPYGMDGGYDNRRRRHRWLEMMIAEFENDENVHIVNTHGAVSPANFVNPPHPDGNGHGQIHDMTWPTVAHFASDA